MITLHVAIEKSSILLQLTIIRAPKLFHILDAPILVSPAEGLNGTFRRLRGEKDLRVSF